MNEMERIKLMIQQRNAPKVEVNTIAVSKFGKSGINSSKPIER